MKSFRVAQWRIVLVHLGIFGLIIGHFISFLEGRDYWPFSGYPMYSKVELDTSMRRMRLYGVHADTGEEIDLMTDSDYIVPFDMTRLHFALRNLQWREPEMMQKALASLLDLYEQRRQTQAHEGPSLAALRVYEFEWWVNPQISNLNEPERRDLTAEFPADEEDPKP